ncbi:MAG: lamin tail domain-containing protein, partial [Verrucomicrobiales bacterium]
MKKITISIAALLFCVGIAPAAPVINEIHFNPPENPVRQEFVEIYNPGPDAIDLGGWRLSSAVDFVFPEPTPLPVGAYVLVAEDPATISNTFGMSALGPWLGKLSSDGETVRLRDAADTVIDEADYKVGFPWPVAANGGGASIELINPTLDNGLGSSWRASEPAPTPGAANSVFTANAAPSIRKVAHSPETPASGEAITITALVTDPDGVASVTLEYQIVTPGAYIPSHLPHPIVSRRIPAAITEPETPLAENPDYNDPANWTTVSMVDEGDGVFSVEISPQAHRSLLRYRITVEDGLGLAARVPYPDDASLNFACFIYDGVPDYNGHSATELTTLPVYQVVTRDADWRECYAWSSTDQIDQGAGHDDRHFYNWTGTFIYDGVVYDNIRYRLRGANGRYQKIGKRSMRFRFNDGHYMQARRQDGTPFGQKWRTLTTGKGFENRGTLTYSLNEALNMFLWNKIGLPAQDTLWAHLRVIDNADEAPDQWHGDFWGLLYVVETYDVRFLEEHG